MAYITHKKHAPGQQPMRASGLALSALALTAALPVHAADPTLPTVNVNASADGYKVDQAASSKYTAPLLNTSKSVTVISSEVLNQSNATTLQEALRTVPGITFGIGEGGIPAGDRPFLRGFDSQANFFVDGLRDPSSQSRDMFAVEQIDVVKGADSAYSGGGAVGGSINLSTKHARLGNFNEATVGLGSDSYQRLTADLNRQLGEHAAVRVNVLAFQSDVPGRDKVDLKHSGIAPSLALGLGTPTRLNVDLYHYETDDMPDYGLPYNNPYTVGTANAKYNGDGGPLSVNRNNFYGLTGRDFRKTKVDSGTIKIEHDLGSQLTFRNSTRYTKSGNDYVVSNPGDTSGLNITPSSFTVGSGALAVLVPAGYLNRSAKSRNSTNDSLINATELVGEFTTGGIKHNFATGFEISRTEVDNRNYVSTPPTPANIANPNPDDAWTGTLRRNSVGTKTVTTSKGLYAFDTLTLTPQWLLNLGLRYDKYSTKADGYSVTGLVDPTSTSPAPGSAYLPTSFANNSSFWSYQAGVVYKPQRNGSIYLNYATATNPSGISSGDGFDNISVTNKDLEPEKVRSIELGTKWNVLNDQLALTAAVFNLEKTNAKVNLDANTMATAGKQRVNGIELGFAGALSKAWQVFGGYTHLDSSLIDNGPMAANSVNNGKQFPNTPKDSFSLWSTYQVMPKLTLGGGAYYMAKVYGNAANTKWVPDYWRFDAVGTYQLNASTTLRLNIQNLFDKTYYDKAYASHMVSVAPARQAMLTAVFKF